MLHQQHHLEQDYHDESLYSPWENLEDGLEDHPFLVPISPFFTENPQSQQRSSSPQSQSLQIDAEKSHKYSKTRSTIGSPSTPYRKETCSKSVSKTHRNIMINSSIVSPSKKKNTLRKAYSRIEAEDKLFFTNNVICLKLNISNRNNPNVHEHLQQTQKKNQLGSLFFDRIHISESKKTNFNSEKQRISFERTPKQVGISEFKSQKQSSLHDNFTIKRNLLRIGKSRKTVQLM